MLDQVECQDLEFYGTKFSPHSKSSVVTSLNSRPGIIKDIGSVYVMAFKLRANFYLDFPSASTHSPYEPSCQVITSNPYHEQK